MKLTITLDPLEVEDALLEKIRVNEELRKMQTWIMEVRATKKDGYMYPAIEIDLSVEATF